jgi:FG-GAP-like repeat
MKPPGAANKCQKLIALVLSLIAAVYVHAADFNGDGHSDYLLMNSNRYLTVWHLNNTKNLSSIASNFTVPARWIIADVQDFNHDGCADLFLYNPTTRWTALWYLRENRTINRLTVIAKTGGVGFPAGTMTIGAADMNHDGAMDLLVEDITTGNVYCHFMRSFTQGLYSAGKVIGQIPFGWNVESITDINKDGTPDIVLRNISTRQTAVSFYRYNSSIANAAFIGRGYGPTLPIGWKIENVADYNGDGYPDMVLVNATGQTVIWYMRSNFYAGRAYGPTLALGWAFAVDAAGPCIFRVTPTTAYFLPSGGYGTVLVGVDHPECTWAATSNVSWLKIISGAPGRGPGLVTYHADATPGGQRTAIITIKGTNSPNVPATFYGVQNGSGLSGNWTGTVHITDYCGNPYISNISLTMSQTANLVTSTNLYSAQFPCIGFPCVFSGYSTMTGTMSAGLIGTTTLNGSFTVTSCGGTTTYAFTSTVSGNTIQGTLDVAAGSVTFTLTR